MDEFLEEDDTVPATVEPPARATTQLEWPPDPDPPAPRGPQPPRRAAIFRAITESKLL